MDNRETERRRKTQEKEERRGIYTVKAFKYITASDKLKKGQTRIKGV